MECQYIKTHNDNITFQASSTAQIYEDVFPVAAKIIHRFGGSYQDARDIFHDAMIIFLESQKDSHRNIRQVRPYVLGIVKYICYRHFHKKVFVEDIASIDAQICIPDDFHPHLNDRRLFRFLEIAGKKCFKLLYQCYYTMLPLKEIAQKLGFANEHSVSVQKYKCLEKLKKIVAEKSIEYEDFLE